MSIWGFQMELMIWVSLYIGSVEKFEPNILGYLRSDLIIRDTDLSYNKAFRQLRVSTELLES